MKTLFIPAVFPQKILIILCCGWGLHSFVSIQVEFPRVFPGRKPQCRSVIFIAWSTQLSGVAAPGALSSTAGFTSAGLPLLPLWSAGPGGATLLTWHLCCMGHTWLEPLVIVWAPDTSQSSEPKISQEVKASGVFLPHTCQDLGQTFPTSSFPN